MRPCRAPDPQNTLIAIWQAQPAGQDDTCLYTATYPPAVQNIAIWHERMGLSADEIATEYDLTLADIYAALAYYYDHQAEIDAAIKEDEAFVEALRQISPSKLPEKLRGRPD